MVCLVFIQYSSITFLLVMIVPSTVELYSILLTSASLYRVDMVILVFLKIIYDFPLQCIVFGIIFQISVSFVKTMWQNLDFKDLMKKITDILYDPTKDFTFVLTQLVVFVVFLSIIISCAVYEFLVGKIIYTGFVIITLGLIPVAFGFYKIIIKSWEILFRLIYFREPKTKEKPIELDLLNAKEEETQKDSNIITESRLIFPVHLFDPAELSNPTKWIGSLEESYSSFFSNGNWKSFRTLFLLPVVLTFVLFMYIQISAIPSLIETNPSTRSIVDYTFTFIFFLVFFPFCIICNVFFVFFGDKKLYNDKSSNGTVFLTTILFCIGSMVIIVLFGTFLYVQDLPGVTPNMTYINLTGINSRKEQTIPSFCEGNIPGGFNLLDLAGLSVIPSLISLNKSKNTLQYKDNAAEFYQNFSKFAIRQELFIEDPLNSSFVTASYLPLSRQQTYYDYIVSRLTFPKIQNTVVYVFDSHSSLFSMALYLETLQSVLIPHLLKSIIPFYALVDVIMQYHIDTFWKMGYYFTILKPIHYSIFNDINKRMMIDRMNNQTIILVGHSVGGTFVKKAWSKHISHGVSFEGFSIVEPNISTHNPNRMSVFVDSSLLGGIDSFITRNVKYPSINSFWGLNSVFDVFCLTTAHCSIDDRYVPLCSQVLNYDGINGTVAYESMRKKAQYDLFK